MNFSESANGSPRWEHILGVALDYLETEPADLEPARRVLRQLRGVAAVKVEVIEPIAWEEANGDVESVWSVSRDAEGRELSVYHVPSKTLIAGDWFGSALASVEFYNGDGNPISRRTLIRPRPAGRPPPTATPRARPEMHPMSTCIPVASATTLREADGAHLASSGSRSA